MPRPGEVRLLGMRLTPVEALILGLLAGASLAWVVTAAILQIIAFEVLRTGL